MNLISILAAVLIALGAVQTPQEAPTPPEAQTPAPTAPNTMTPLELAKIDVLAVTRQRDEALDALGTCQATLTPLQSQQRNNRLYQQIQTLRTLIESAHPGQQWNLEKGALEPKPAEKKTAAPTPAPSPAPASVPVEPVKPKPQKE